MIKEKETHTAKTRKVAHATSRSNVTGFSYGDENKFTG